MAKDKPIDEREEQPLADQSKLVLGHESAQQGLDPQSDTFQDQMNDAGQEIEDELLAEERDPRSLFDDPTGKSRTGSEHQRDITPPPNPLAPRPES